MKILIVSDTHGRCTNLERVLAMVRPIDLLIHLGDIERDRDYIEAICDCPMEVVAGNNDFLSSDPRELLLPLGNHLVFAAHGNRYAVNGGPFLIKKQAKEKGADIVMYGHTHVPLVDLSDDIWVLNPGSLSLPRNSSKPSYIIMEIDKAGEAHVTLKSI